MNHIIFMLQAVIALLRNYPDTIPTQPPYHVSHAYHARACKTDSQFESRIAYVNQQNNHLRLEISELRGYLRSFAKPKHYGDSPF